MTPADPKSSIPKVFQYLEYRDFLRDWLAYQKKSRQRLTQRKFIQRVGLPQSCSSLIPAIIKGKRTLSQSKIVQFSQAMELSEREHDYWENLVKFNQAKTMPEKNHHFERLSKFWKSKAQTLKQEQLEFLSKWFYTAIRNYCGMKQNDCKPSDIADFLFPQISPQQVKLAIELLLNLGLLKKTANGYKPSDPHVTTEMNVHADLAKKHVLEMLELSKSVMEKVPAKHRQYNTLSFSISEQAFYTIKDRIRAFQEELREIIEKDSKEDRLYTLSMQFFPNSKVGE